jgi:hypothetical protein
MDIDRPSGTGSKNISSSSGGGAPGELKIKGQAELERRKSKWEDDSLDDVRKLDISVDVMLTNFFLSFSSFMFVFRPLKSASLKNGKMSLRKKPLGTRSCDRGRRAEHGFGRGFQIPGGGWMELANQLGQISFEHFLSFLFSLLPCLSENTQT